jgi:SPP1 family phage portal protein
VKGRRQIFTDLIPTGDIEADKKIIPIILEKALTVHQENVDEIKTLFEYYYNETKIEEKTKTQQKDINNKVAIPYANIAVNTINSYCFSSPFTRSSRNSDEKITELVKLFNDALDDDDYDSKTAEAEMNSGICGYGYKFVRPATLEEKAEGLWFKTSGDLDPTTTFIVKSNTMDKEDVLACTYYERTKYDGDFKENGKQSVYNVYTKYHYWVFVKDDSSTEYAVELQDLGNVKSLAYPLVYERIPIIQYVRKQDRTCDFEIAKSLIDSINNLASSRVDDVQQAVDYILLLRDIACDTDEEINAITKAVAKGILAFRSIQNASVQPSVEVLNTRINQSEVQTLQDFLCKKVEEALHIPNRETRGSSGDTGTAVENRAGYRSLENIAGLITLQARRAETKALDTILQICKAQSNCPFASLTVNDIEIKANRNKVENLTTASNAYNTLRSAGMNDIDALNACELVPDSIGTASRNKSEAEENQKKQIELAQQTAKTQESNDDSSKKSEKSESKSV